MGPYSANFVVIVFDMWPIPSCKFTWVAHITVHIGPINVKYAATLS